MKIFILKFILCNDDDLIEYFTALSVHMLSKSQTWTLDAGQTAQLECEFIADSFNLFDNPIIWRKRQHLQRRRPTAIPAVASLHTGGQTASHEVTS